jgi:putative glutathione S-transferase
VGKLIDGVWHPGEIPADARGAFVRKSTSFRSTAPTAESGRYHLYVSLACPWAHRTLIGRSLLGLQSRIGASVVHWLDGEHGWFFDSVGADCTSDGANGFPFLKDVYVKADPRFTGSVTVPVFWDSRDGVIVNNESREILRQFCTLFGPAGGATLDLSPPHLREHIDATLDAIYEPINNGVYRAGFARSQDAYDEAVATLFEALDHWDDVLGRQPFMCGDLVTEADLCIFTTLLRFDAVYAVLFKCSRRRIVDYPNLWPYLRSIYQLPGVAETCNLHHIRSHYYSSLRGVNPTGIIALAPDLDFRASHDRFARFNVEEPFCKP